MNVIVRPNRPAARTKALHAMIEEFGARAVLLATLQVVLRRRRRKTLPPAPLNAHLRRDIGLAPKAPPDRLRGPLF